MCLVAHYYCWHSYIVFFYIFKICTASGSAVVVIYAVVVAATAENSFLGGFSWKIIVVSTL